MYSILYLPTATYIPNNIYSYLTNISSRRLFYSHKEAYRFLRKFFARFNQGRDRLNIDFDSILFASHKDICIKGRKAIRLSSFWANQHRKRILLPSPNNSHLLVHIKNTDDALALHSYLNNHSFGGVPPAFFYRLSFFEIIKEVK